MHVGGPCASMSIIYGTSTRRTPLHGVGFMPRARSIVWDTESGRGTVQIMGLGFPLPGVRSRLWDSGVGWGTVQLVGRGRCRGTVQVVGRGHCWGTVQLVDAGAAGARSKLWDAGAAGALVAKQTSFEGVRPGCLCLGLGKCTSLNNTRSC